MSRRLTEHGTVADAQELGLVVARDGGVGVRVAREEGQLAREVGFRCVHIVFLFFLIQRYSFYYINSYFLNFICLILYK